jgi:hypothetical protein
MIHNNKSSCFSITEKDKYPFDEVLLFFTECENDNLSKLTVDTEEVLLRKLIPVSSIEALTNRKEIYLHSIEFACYDTSARELEKEEGAFKDYAGESIRGNMLTSSWQPNYCRPIVLINGINMTSSISSYNEQGISTVIGLPLPFCLTINKIIKEPKEIEIYGALAQRTNGGYRNYPLLAIINFWHNFN